MCQRKNGSVGQKNGTLLSSIEQKKKEKDTARIPNLWVVQFNSYIVNRKK